VSDLRARFDRDGYSAVGWGPLVEHDLSRVEDDLKECLSQGRHSVAVLVGAGCPASVRVGGAAGTGPLIPGIEGLTDVVRHALRGNGAFSTLLGQFAEDEKTSPTVEHMLSHLRALRRVAGSGHARGLDMSQLVELDEKICIEVTRVVRARLPAVDTPYHRFARWVKGGGRTAPVHVFTTNYDVLIEDAFEADEVRYFDGFIGSNRPFFDPLAIEEDQFPTSWARLWKMHGSINWEEHGDSDKRRVIRVPVPEDGAAGLLIYPSEYKYEQSRRLPYVAMLDRLRAFLRQGQPVLVTCGYSFADEHLNDIIFESLRRNKSGAAYGLLFRDFVEERAADLARRHAPPNVSLLARDKAALRGVLGDWKAQESPSGPVKAEFKLGDFGAFSDFLNQVSG
jgi:hypothetical protein